MTTNLFINFLIIACICEVIMSGKTYEGISNPDPNPKNLHPTVFVGLLIRNKEHTLPYFLHYVENIDYPKDRMILWIHSDHNIDNSINMVRTWLNQVESSYHKVYAFEEDKEKCYEDEKGPCDWSKLRYEQVIRLRQQILDTARSVWADYVFYVDADNILMNNQVLKDLIAEQRTVIAPMLRCTGYEEYSNFWTAMDEFGFYMYNDNYMDLVLRKDIGCFSVANVYATFLIDLRHEDSAKLSFSTPPQGYTGVRDDLIIFGVVAKAYNIPLHVLNKVFYGWLPLPMGDNPSLEQEAQKFTHTLIENIIYNTPLQKLPYFDIKKPVPSKLGFDQIYVINLKRRPDRRRKMLECFAELGIEAKIVEAVDGRALNETYLSELGVKILEGYTDPFLKRKMTMGEIGCYLSHYFIWQEVSDKKYSRVLIFEDDIRFQPLFTQKAMNVLHETDRLSIDWDLLYLGRKHMDPEGERLVEGSEFLVHAHYSYWMLGYALTLRGTNKLLRNNPLGKMIPSDEYLPIMCDQHPRKDWKQEYGPRDMVCLASEPLLVFPTHYTGQQGHFSDTEASEVISEELQQSMDALKPDGPWDTQKDTKDEL